MQSPTTPVDFQEIEARAHQLRAEAMRFALGVTGAWVSRVAHSIIHRVSHLGATLPSKA